MSSLVPLHPAHTRPSIRPHSRRRRARPVTLLLTWALTLGLSVAAAARAEPPQPPPPAETGSVRSRSEESLAVRGIYLQQLTVQDEKRLAELISSAKAVGLNTFVVDLWRRSTAYEKAVQTIRGAGLSYVPRITMFPDGARRDQIDDQGLLDKRWRLVDYALKLGATDIQLDYIRFSSRNPPSSENAQKVLGVVRSFRQRIQQRGARLQIDTFGEVSYGPSTRIGQDIGLFAPELDAVCPMLYPSHFEPYKETARAPYQTVHGALMALERQTKSHPISVYPFIESFNYRFRMTDAERAGYFEAQLEAVLDSSARGFYVWSVGNHYDIPFAVLERRARERAARTPPVGGPSSASHGSLHNPATY